MSGDNLTLGEHCKLFYKDRYGIDIPSYETDLGKKYYELWIDYAFSNVDNTKKGEKKTQEALNVISLFL